MAQSVLKLQVDDKQYNASLKEAKHGMQELQRALESAGKTFDDCDSAVADYARQLGQMETTSKTARGEISELSSAFVELSRVYQQMTDQEKSSPVGQALAQSLDELKSRTIEAKEQMGELSKQLEPVKQGAGDTGGVLDQLSGKFGISTDKLLTLGGALGAATGALAVAKDAFFSNEEQLDEWGRIVESSHSLYRGFLDALNTGDISGFLSRMDTIVAAARAAYDALDELATFNAFNQVNLQRARVGLQDSMNDYRSGTGSKEGVQQAGEALKKELRERQKKETDAYSAAIAKVAAERGVSATDLAKVFTGNYGDYKTLKATPLTGRRYVTQAYGQWGGGYTYEVKTAANERERMGDALRRLNDTEIDQLQKLGAQAQQTAFEIEQVDRQTGRVLNSGRGGGGAGRGGGVGRVGRGGRGGGGGGGVVKTETQLNNEQIAKLNQEYLKATDERKTAIRSEIKTLQDRNKEIQQLIDESNGKGAPEGSMAALSQEVSELQKQQQLATTPEQWKEYQRQIDEAQRKMKALKGEVEELQEGMAGLSKNSMSAWLSGQQQSLSGAQIGSEEYAALSANILDTQTLQNVINTALKNDITISPDTLEDLWGQIISGEDIPDETWTTLAETINAAIEGLDIEPIEIDVKSGGVRQVAKQTKESWQDAAKAVQAVGGALEQLEDPGAKVAGLVGQAIANIALGFAQATAKSSNLGIFGWIAAIAGGLATMISTISAIKSATAGSYAEGGIVGGNSWSGDNLQANVNSGELILNRAQQDNVASQLTGGVGGNLRLSAVVTGEQIRLALNNHSRRMGRGEYVTSKN